MSDSGDTKPKQEQATRGSSGGDPDPGRQRRLDVPRAAVGLVTLVVSIYLISQELGGRDTSLFMTGSGPLLNIAGVVAGGWILVSAWRR